jgi:hypothetical protein
MSYGDEISRYRPTDQLVEYSLPQDGIRYDVLEYRLKSLFGEDASCRKGLIMTTVRAKPFQSLARLTFAGPTRLLYHFLATSNHGADLPFDTLESFSDKSLSRE